MSHVGILVIGNEILDGIVLDTNSQWIIKQLKQLNFDVKETMTVRDSTDEISLAIERMRKDNCNIIFTTGGLGPTHDDMTLKGLAQAFDLPVDVNKEALDIVKRQYKMLHEKDIVNSNEITESRRKMAVLPKGSEPLDNQVGGAPGVLILRENLRIFCLPGVPKELKWIFENEIIPLLGPDEGGYFAEKIIVLPLRDETTLAPIIDEVMEKYQGIYIKSLVKPYGEEGIRLWISGRGEDKEKINRELDNVAELIKEITEERLSD